MAGKTQNGRTQNKSGGKAGCEKTRLNKYLAESGVCSRREADKLIAEGRVTLNGKVAQLGSVVTGNVTITVDGKPVKGKRDKVVLAYYKPTGVTCTEKDPFADKTILQSLNYPERVTYAGRLDKDSEGLMIMTNDGDLIHAMMRGANRHEKEYIVKVHKEVTQEFLDGMAAGVYLAELKERTRVCQVEMIGKYTFRIILTQGLNRQIRRMCKEFGYQVVTLKRVRIMNVELGDLKYNKYREITGTELTELYERAGLLHGNKETL